MAGKDRVVGTKSAKGFCEEPDTIPDKGHIGAVKPENKLDTSYLILRNFIYVPPEKKVEEKKKEPGALPPVWNVPHLRNLNFTGREKLLDDLRNALTSGQPAALTQAIQGLGGVGKTQLATEYAYRFAGEYEIVWWIRSEDPATLNSDYAALATARSLPEKDVPDQTVVTQAVRSWLNHNGKWLLIFDNARESNDLKHLLPQAQTGNVIITSRTQAWEGVARGFRVTKFNREESIKYLCKRTGTTDQKAANDLAEELGDLPLALAQASGFIDTAKKSIADYLQLYKKHQQKLLEKGKPDPGYPLTIATTWTLSLDQAKKVSPLAEDLLKLCAFFAPDNIPRELLKDGLTRMKGSDDLAFEDALAALHANSLTEATPDSVSLHRLVQSVTKARMEDAEKRQCVSTVIALMDTAFSSLGSPPQDVRSWPMCQKLLPHSSASISASEELQETSQNLGSLLNWCGMYWHGRAIYAEAEPLYRRALKIREEQLGADHPSVATSLNNLAALLQAQGKYAEAEPLHRRALKIREEQLAADHPDVAQSLNSLAALLRDQGKYAEAEPLCRRALKICEDQLGADHPDVAITLNGLAALLQAQRNYAEAEPLYRRAMKISEERLSADHPHVANSLNNLAALLKDQGKYAEAEPLYRRALKIFEEQLGANHPDVATSLNNLAELLRAQGKYTEAEPLYRRALKIREEQLGADHPDVAQSLNNLALLVHAQGKYAEAEPLYRRALKILEKSLGTDHPNTQRVRENLQALLDEAKGKK